MTLPLPAAAPVRVFTHNKHPGLAAAALSGGTATRSRAAMCSSRAAGAAPAARRQGPLKPAVNGGDPAKT